MNGRLYGAIALATLLLYLLTFRSELLEQSDRLLYDGCRKIADALQPALLAEQAAVVVEIDEKSLSRLGQWPWPRVVTAKLFQTIGSYKPAGIAVDLIFPESDRTSPRELFRFYRDFFGITLRLEGLPAWLHDNDLLLAETIADLPVTLPIYLQNVPGSAPCSYRTGYTVASQGSDSLYRAAGLLCNIEPLQQSARSVGFINASEDPDGIFRRMPLAMRYDGKPVATLALASLLASGLYNNRMELQESPWGPQAKVAGGAYYTDEHSNVLLRFYPLDSYRRISAVDLLTGSADPEALRGKFVLLGATATGLHDRYTVAAGEKVPGIFMHATLLENLFNGDLISQPQFLRGFNAFLSFSALMLILWMMRRKRYFAIVLFIAAAVALYTAATVAGLLNHLYIAPGYFLTPFVGGSALIAIALAAIGYTHRKRFYEQLGKAHQATLESMALVAETRDTETGAHIVRTKEYVRLLARALSRREAYTRQIDDTFIEHLFHAAPLHDIGKVGIPDAILKKPAKLTFEEFETMKTHTVCGKEIIDNAISSYRENAILEIARNIAYCHHEKWDGSGYPVGLSGAAIPIEARLMAVADVYDALISRRYYKEAFSFEEAEGLILEGRGSHFDPEIVDTFVELREEFRQVAERYR